MFIVASKDSRAPARVFPLIWLHLIYLVFVIFAYDCWWVWCL